MESWQEKVTYGQEFANFSWVTLSDLQKSTEYHLRLTVFSLAGDGWPSEEILNSTMDDGTIDFLLSFYVILKLNYL